MTHLCFEVWGWHGHTCVKNQPWVGGKVCAKFGGDWSSRDIGI